MEIKTTKSDLLLQLAWHIDGLTSVYNRIAIASAETFEHLEMNENTFVSEFAAIQFFGLVGYDFKDFERIMDAYGIQTYIIQPGNIRSYRKSEIIEAKRHFIQHDSWSNRLAEIKAKNQNQSDITHKIGELLSQSGLSWSGEI